MEYTFFLPYIPYILSSFYFYPFSGLFACVWDALRLRFLFASCYLYFHPYYVPTQSSPSLLSPIRYKLELVGHGRKLTWEAKPRRYLFLRTPCLAPSLFSLLSYCAFIETMQSLPTSLPAFSALMYYRIHYLLHCNTSFSLPSPLLSFSLPLSLLPPLPPSSPPFLPLSPSLPLTPSQHSLQYFQCDLQQRLPHIRDSNGVSFRRQRKSCYQCYNLQDIVLLTHH